MGGSSSEDSLTARARLRRRGGASSEEEGLGARALRRGVLRGGSYPSEGEDGLGVRGFRFFAGVRFATVTGFTGFTGFEGFTGFAGLVGFGVGGEVLGERLLGSEGVGSGTSTTTGRGAFGLFKLPFGRPAFLGTGYI